MAENDAFRKGLSIAARVGVELVAATVVGAGLGYGLDYWLGTAPWFLVVGVFLGGTAGLLGIIRLAKNM
jgi:ATP synthase protein I